MSSTLTAQLKEVQFKAHTLSNAEQVADDVLYVMNSGVAFLKRSESASSIRCFTGPCWLLNRGFSWTRSVP